MLSRGLLPLLVHFAVDEESRRFPGPVHRHVDRRRRAGRALAVLHRVGEDLVRLLSAIQGLEGAVGIEGQGLVRVQRDAGAVAEDDRAADRDGLAVNGADVQRVALEVLVVREHVDDDGGILARRRGVAAGDGGVVLVEPDRHVAELERLDLLEVVDAVAVRDEVRDRHLVVAGALRGDVVFEERAGDRWPYRSPGRRRCRRCRRRP